MSTSLLILEFEHTKGHFIEGDCSIPGYEGKISLESFSWDLKVDEVANNPGQTAIKLERLRMTKYYDRASVPMCNMMINKEKMGEFWKATLKFIDPSTTASKGFQSVMEMEMSDGHIEEISIKTSEGRSSLSIREDVVLSFHTVQLFYQPFDPKTGVRAKPVYFKATMPKVGEK